MLPLMLLFMRLLEFGQIKSTKFCKPEYRRRNQRLAIYRTLLGEKYSSTVFLTLKQLYKGLSNFVLIGNTIY